MDYIAKIKKLPQPIQDILISPFGAEVNGMIREKYKLDSEQTSVMIDLVNDIYIQERKVVELEGAIKDVLKMDDNNAKLLALDIAGMKLLVADDYFRGEVKKLIDSLGGKIESYSDILKKIQTALEKEKKYYEDDLAKEAVDDVKKPAKKKLPPIKPLSTDQKKNRLKDVFTQSIVPLLNYEDMDEFLDEVNDEIMELISKENTFKQSLSSALIVNNEILTDKEFTLDNKPAQPTVANWLKDFIKQYGAGNFDNVKLARYLSSAKNVKMLDEGQRQLLRKLLGLYRNITFFPESMPNDTGEGWEIFPMTKEDVFTKIKQAKSTRTIKQLRAEDKNVKVRKENDHANVALSHDDSASQAEELSKLKKNIKKQNVAPVQDDKLVALEKLANDYPKDSLEYRALQEEISKLKVKS